MFVPRLGGKFKTQPPSPLLTRDTTLRWNVFVCAGLPTRFLVTFGFTCCYLPLLLLLLLLLQCDFENIFLCRRFSYALPTFPLQGNMRGPCQRCWIVPKLQFVVRAMAANSQSCHLYICSCLLSSALPFLHHPCSTQQPHTFSNFPTAWVVLGGWRWFCWGQLIYDTQMNFDADWINFESDFCVEFSICMAFFLAFPAPLLYFAAKKTTNLSNTDAKTKIN